MSRQKGTPKTGGRAKGTPNKVTCTIKQFITQLIDDNRQQIIDDLNKLQPFQRLSVLERLLAYVIPRQQPASQDAIIEAEFRHIERLIQILPDEAIERITEKIITINKHKKDEQQELIA